MANHDPLLTFENHFELSIATSDLEKEACYALRYRVYCQEFDYISKSQCKKNRETDALDREAVHLMLRLRKDNSLVGCSRLLVPNAVMNTVCYPFEAYCQKEYNPRFTKNADTISYGELSRITVSPDFRQRIGDSTKANGMSPYHHGSMEDDRNFPLLSLSLGLGSLLVAQSQQFDYLFSMMAPRLAFAFSHYGIIFNQVGLLVDHHGKTATYRTEPTDVWQTIDKKLKPLLMAIDNDINGIQQAPDTIKKGA